MGPLPFAHPWEKGGRALPCRWSDHTVRRGVARNRVVRYPNLVPPQRKDMMTTDDTAARVLIESMGHVKQFTDDTSYLLDGALDQIKQIQGGLESLAVIADHAQAIKRGMLLIEAEAARAAGEMKRSGIKPSERLPDGRVYELRRSTTRRAWDHGGWKTEVLNRALHGVSRHLIDPATGEVVDVGEIVARVQDVHGSTSPRVAKLRELDIDPSEFCAETPGPWAFSITPRKDQA